MGEVTSLEAAGKSGQRLIEAVVRQSGGALYIAAIRFIHDHRRPGRLVNVIIQKSIYERFRSAFTEKGP
jgi:hypothetical protein